MKITKDLLEKASKEFETYLGGRAFKEEELLRNCLRQFPSNDKGEQIALKCAIIDVTNSTHLSLHKRKLSITDLVAHILNIQNIDERIKRGDATVVDEIANNGEINLFSFAIKYCCYSSLYIYENDNFSIYDNFLCNGIPEICQWQEYKDKTIKELDGKYNIYTLGDIKNSNIIRKFKSNYGFKSYQIIIDTILQDIENVENKRRKFDHFVWMNIMNDKWREKFTKNDERNK